LTVALTSVVISDMNLQVSITLELFETESTPCAGRKVNVVAVVVVVGGPFVGLQVGQRSFEVNGHDMLL
jgi:hypothetical protein